MAIKFSLSPDPTFLVPDIKSLIKFVNGDLGISDKRKTKTIIDNCSSIKSVEELDKFKSLMNFSLNGPSEKFIVNDRCVVKQSDIILNESDDLSGLKSLEKSLIQSIFETQKPYADVFINTTGSLVKIEDIIARVLSVGGSSLKPSVNPKALGYKPATKSLLNSGLSKLDSLSKKKSTISGTISDNIPTQSTDNIDKSFGIDYKVLSTVYSTGEYDESVKYNYEYIDIVDDTTTESDLLDNTIDVLNNEEEHALPKVIVFGLFDDKGNVVSDESIPKWLIDSGKWYGQFNMISDFKYVWEHPLFSDRKSVASPGKGWSQKLDENEIPITVFDKNDNIDHIKTYYNNIIDNNLIKNKISKQDSLDISNEINTRVDYKLQATALISSGFLPTLKLKSGSIPIKKYPFLPKKINFNQSDIWVDPEDKYDMKVIKVVPTFKVKFYDDKNKLIEGTISPIDISKKLQKNTIEVLTSTKQRLVININQIKNDQLSINTPYSKGFYGSSDDDHLQDIEEVLRYVTLLSDNKPLYLIEGILEDKNTQAFPVADSSGSSGAAYYRKPKGPISAIGAFIKMLIDVFSKLIPSIKNIYNILSNPSKFIVDILLTKLGDNNGVENIKFDLFSKKFKGDFNKLSTMKPSDRQEFVSKSKIKNYVYVDDNGDYKFLLDGTSLVKFLSFTFGISINKLSPKLTFKSDNTKSKKALNDFLSLTNDQKEIQVDISDLSNTSLKPKLNVSNNQIRTTANGVTTIEEVSIQYSTGEYIDGVDYDYVYVTEYVNDLISEGDKLVESDDEESQLLAIAKYEEAIKLDPNNKIIKSKLDDLKGKVGSNTQPILDFLLNMITFPFKIIKNIIDYIIDFFKSLSNPFKLPSQIKTFISFKWVIDILSPNKILELIGIKFDIGQFNSWIRSIDTFPDDHQFDLSKIISMPFMPKLFSVDKTGLKALTKSPISMLSSILCLVESIVNSFIDFLWALMGLKSILNPPYIKLCKDTNMDINEKALMGLLDGNYSDVLNIDSDSVGTEQSYDFAYEITLPDGRTVRDLNYEELNIWIEENKGILFEFDF